MLRQVSIGGLGNLTNASIDVLQNASVECKRFRGGTFAVEEQKCYPGYRYLPLFRGSVGVYCYGYVLPFLVVAVVLSNVFVVLVLSKPHMRSPTNLILLYMAIADLFVGIVPFPFTLYFYTMGRYKSQGGVELWTCHLYHYMMNAFPPICHSIAMWLTVFLALQRFVYINYPLHSSHLCTIRNVRIATTIICCASAAAGLPKIVEHQLVLIPGHILGFAQRRRLVGNSTVVEAVYKLAQGPICAYRFPDYVKRIGINNFYNFYFWTRAIFFILIPSVLLILLNACLVKGVHDAELRKKRLLRENRGREARRATESNSTSTMLVIIVTVFLLVNLPQGIFIAIICFDSTFNLGIVKSANSEYLQLFLATDNLLILATYPFNFAIYCSMSAAFRETFMRLFCRNLPPIRQRASSLVGVSLRRLESFRGRGELLPLRPPSPVPFQAPRPPVTHHDSSRSQLTLDGRKASGQESRKLSGSSGGPLGRGKASAASFQARSQGGGSFRRIEEERSSLLNPCPAAQRQAVVVPGAGRDDSTRFFDNLSIAKSSVTGGNGVAGGSNGPSESEVEIAEGQRRHPVATRHSSLIFNRKDRFGSRRSVALERDGSLVRHSRRGSRRRASTPHNAKFSPLLESPKRGEKSPLGAESWDEDLERVRLISPHTIHGILETNEATSV